MGGAITAKAGAGINVVDTIRLDNNGRARYEGTLSGEDVRYYKFTPTKTGILKVTTSGSEVRIEETIREEFSNKLLINTYNNHQDSYTLAKGTTYLIGVENAFSFYDNNNYTVSFEYKEAKETFPEDYFNENENEEIDQARSLELNKTYYGARTITEEAEWYKFTLNKDSKVFIALSDNAYGSIYDSNKQREVMDYGMYGWCRQLELKKGTYYINIRILPKKVGQYSICINDLTTSKSSTTKLTKQSNLHHKNKQRFKKLKSA